MKDKQAAYINNKKSKVKSKLSLRTTKEAQIHESLKNPMRITEYKSGISDSQVSGQEWTIY